MPSHFCGVFGLKPSFGRVPYYPVGTGDYTSHIGPMTRTVADSALMLEVMAGPHPLDYTTLEAGPADYLAPAARRHQRQAHRLQPRSRPRARRSRCRRAGEGRRRRASPNSARTVEEVTTPWAAPGPELIRFFWAAHLTRLAPHLAKWETQMDPGLVACIKAATNVSVARLPGDARAQDGLHRRDPSLVRGLGLPADARRFRSPPSRPSS